MLQSHRGTPCANPVCNRMTWSKTGYCRLCQPAARRSCTQCRRRTQSVTGLCAKCRHDARMCTRCHDCWKQTGTGLCRKCERETGVKPHGNMIGWKPRLSSECSRCGGWTQAVSKVCKACHEKERIGRAPHVPESRYVSGPLRTVVIGSEVFEVMFDGSVQG
jgi:hypothetical protein